jgi:hypothetical protein
MNLLEWLDEQTGMDQICGGHRAGPQLRQVTKWWLPWRVLPVFFWLDIAWDRPMVGKYLLT